MKISDRPTILYNLDKLPKELQGQLLCLKDKDAFTKEIISCLKSFQGIANIDEILVGLYQATGKIHQREFLMNKLYRMTQKGLLVSLKGKRGIYQIPESATGKGE